MPQRRTRITLIAQAFAVTLALVFSVSARQKESRPAKSGAVEGDNEILWRGRYANCDKGYIVVLPEGFVGHDGAANPGGGFLVSLPDVDTMQRVSFHQARFLWVETSYNSLEWKSLDEVADWSNKVRSSEPGFKILTRESTKLRGQIAKRLVYEYDSPRGRVYEEEVICLRAGIVYEIGLRTLASFYRDDRKRFEKLLLGFRFWRIHNC